MTNTATTLEEVVTYLKKVKAEKPDMYAEEYEEGVVTGRSDLASDMLDEFFNKGAEAA